MRLLAFTFSLFLLVGCTGQPTSNSNSSSDTADSDPYFGKARVVVDFSNDTDPQVFCVEFPGDDVSGILLLQETGLKLVEAPGGLVCRIEQTGCEQTVCLGCACPTFGDPDCRFWSYWHWEDNQWRFSQQGAGDYLVSPGAIEAWKWGNDQMPPTWKPDGSECR